MRTKLAKRVQQRLPKKPFIPAVTTFVTEDGPAIGTIWFDQAQPSLEPSIVKEVDAEANRIHYEDGWDYFTEFLSSVRSGRYILIGIVPNRIGHTVL